MKKTFIFALAVLLALSLAGCGNRRKPQETEPEGTKTVEKAKPEASEGIYAELVFSRNGETVVSEPFLKSNLNEMGKVTSVGIRGESRSDALEGEGTITVKLRLKDGSGWSKPMEFTGDAQTLYAEYENGPYKNVEYVLEATITGADFSQGERCQFFKWEP